MDIKKLAKNINLDTDEYLEFLIEFLKNIKSILKKLHSEINNKDSQSVYTSAHEIKGMALNLGLTEIAELAKNIEVKAKKNIFDGASSTLQSIETKCHLLTKIQTTYTSQSSEQKKLKKSKPIKKKTVLVVDNQPTILNFMTKLLEEKSFYVLTAEDGLSALRILKTEIPEIIFIDLVIIGSRI